MRSRLMAFLGGLRIAAIALAVTALLGLELPLPGKGRSVVLLVDVSASVGAEGTEAARDAALRFLGRLERRDRAAVIAFSGDARLLAGLGSPREASRILESADLAPEEGSETDIALAVSTAASLLSGAGGNRSVYLFSDGRSTRGEGILPARFERSGVSIHAYPVGAAEQGVSVEGFELPEVLRSGERAEASWLLRSAARERIEWTLSVDGAAVASGRAELSEGLNGISLPLPPALPGSHELKVEARDANGDPLETAGSGGVLSVSGPAEILVAGGGASPSPIAAALRAQGMAARAVGVDGLPEEASGYSGVQGVVLDNVNALYVSEAQQERLLSYVAGGGGLLVVGGDQSLGRGEYFATPLEDMLPVTTDTRRRLYFTRARILFVIDSSGSMSEMVNGVSKQAAALRGVADSLADLDPLDEVGILGFDDSPEWLVRFTPAGDKETILEAMTRMRGGGGTDLAEAIQEVIKGFGETGPTRKHAVILTDGLTLEADFEELSRSLAAVGASVTTVGVGEMVNEDLLRKIAELNGGAYYRAEQDQIPRVLVEETVRVSRDLINEGSFAPRESSPSPASSGIAGIAPPVSGYLVTRIKPLARVHLGVDPGQGSIKRGEAPGAPDPLLASWRYGAGKVAVFTSDSGSDWLASWSGKPVYARLWSQVLRDVERGDPDSGMVARAYEEGGALRILVEAVDAERRAARGLELQGRGSGPGSRPFSLRETAPGRYEALVPASARGTEAGVERYAIRDARTGAWTEAWTWKPRDAELSRTGPDAAALAAAASSTGGTVSRADGPFPEAPAVSLRMTPLRWWALLLSLLAFIIELYGRSTLFGQFKMARATLTAWLSRQRTIADRLRDGLRESPRAADDSAKVMDAYRRLAERSIARAEREKEHEG